METWKDVIGYEGIYQVSDIGNVRNVKSGKTLKPNLDTKGYLMIRLYKNAKFKICRVHRLVAEAFIPNPENKPTVDHINTIRTDNRLCNLRWFTQQEQITENKLTREKCMKSSLENLNQMKKVLCITTGEVFESTGDAIRYYDIKDKSAVRNAANPNHKRKYAGKLPDGTKLEWQYID